MRFNDLLKLGLMAGAVAATGGAAAPAVAAEGGAAGLLGTEAATAGLLGSGAATGAGSQAAMLAAQNQGFGAVGQTMLADAAGTSAPMATQAAAGLQKMGEFSNQLKPFGQAAQSAKAINGLLSDDSKPMQAQAPHSGNPQGAQTLSQLYQQGTQLSPMDQARLQRKTMWG